MIYKDTTAATRQSPGTRTRIGMVIRYVNVFLKSSGVAKFAIINNPNMPGMSTSTLVSRGFFSALGVIESSSGTVFFTFNRG